LVRYISETSAVSAIKTVSSDTIILSAGKTAAPKDKELVLLHNSTNVTKIS
jgi:hypothetical protein